MSDDNMAVVELVGQNGNAFVILALCRRAAMKARWSPVKIERVMTEMMQGDYDHLLQTATRYFDVR